MDEKEKEEMGLDQTQLEYSKGFYDPKKHDFPHNTQWFQNYQGVQEPDKVTPVTYSPEMNPEFDKQNSPGGYPNRFCRKPESEWFSDEGEIVPALQHMWKYREAAINSITRDITAGYGPGYWIDPNGKAYQVRGEDDLVTHSDWIKRNKDLLVNEYGIKINNPDRYGYSYFGSKELVGNGWTRIGDSEFGYIGIETPDLAHLPNALNSVLDTIPNSKGIILEDLDKNHVELPFIDEPFSGDIQKMVNKALSQKRMGYIIDNMTRDITKIAVTRQYALYIGGRLATRTLTRQKALRVCQERFPEYFANGDYEVREEAYKVASIENIDGLPVLVNPSEQELINFSQKLRAGRMFRGLLDQHTGDLFVWDAYEAIHQYMIQELGLDIKYSDESPFCLYFNPSPLSISEMLARQQEVKQGKIPRSSSLKQAGSYSSTYTDEQGEQFFNEQHYNNVDEELYVNHDQRDYSWGFHDSPENTGTGVGWAKDNTPYVVRLDQLDNPAYRNNPFNMSEYWVTYYNSMPMSDGIEQMNGD
jgi:hypothetical protein